MAENRYWNGEWPNLNSISLAFGENERILSPTAAGIFYRLAWFCASRGVHSYYKPDPEPMCFPNCDETICRIAGATTAEWENAKESVLAFFRLRDGSWYLRDESIIRLSRDTARAAIPAISKLTAQSRGLRCVYCGDEDGPFDHDHLFPVSRGGSDDPNNIVIACASCNRSKGAKSLLEWMNFNRSRNG
jgi:hypothetical protein